jgi:hypothetical protein
MRPSEGLGVNQDAVDGFVNDQIRREAFIGSRLGDGTLSSW